MKLLLIRHAQSENNVIEDRPDYAQARQPDPPLTAHGHASARQFAQDADLSGVTHGLNGFASHPIGVRITCTPA